MAVGQAIEKGKAMEASVEQRAIAVTQPEKLEGLLETIDLLTKVSERIGEDRSGDMGSSGTGGGQQGDDDGTQQSTREQAIANLPEAPVMRQHLEKHIAGEVKKLRRQVRRAAVRASKPGSAYQLNQLYARIRRLNGVLSELLSASYEVVRRLYIRIFVDKQPVF